MYNAQRKIFNQHENRKYKIGLYCRISRDENFENYGSIENQEAILREFVEKHELGEIKKVYIDDNVSGTKFNRPALNRLVADCENGKIDMVIAKDLSRFGRNQKEFYVFLDRLEKQDIRILAPADEYDTLEYNELVGFKVVLNEFYCRDTSKKIRNVLWQKKRNGEWVGKLPYGYIRDKDRNIVPDPETREVVELIFDLYISGWGCQKICNYLYEKGYPTPNKVKGIARHSDRWCQKQIKRILNHPVYCGDIVQGRYERGYCDPTNFNTKSKNEWLIKKDQFEAIIPRKKFELVQEIQKKRREQAPLRSKKRTHLFSGFLRCGKCGGIFHAKEVRSKPPLYYFCGKYNHIGVKGCTSHKFKEADLYARVCEEIERFILLDQNPKHKEEVINGLLSKSKSIEDVEAEIVHINKTIKDNNQRLKIYYQDRVDGIISVSMYKELAEELTNINMRLEKRKKDLDKQAVDIDIINKSYDNLIKNMKTILDKGELDKYCLEQIINEIWVFYPHEIDEKFKDELTEEQFNQLWNEGGFYIKWKLYYEPQCIYEGDNTVVSVLSWKQV